MPEPEHPEEHPGADRAGRRLAGERGAAPRVQPERQQERDLRENPERRRRSARSASRSVDEVRAEDRVDVDRGEREVVRDRGRVEEERADRERRDDERGEARLSERVSDEQRRGSGGRRLRRRPARARAGSAPPYGYRLGDEQRVRIRLRRVAQARRAEVAHPLGHPAVASAYHHARNAITSATPPSALARMSAGIARKQPEERLPAALPLARGDLDVDPVRAGASREAGEAAPDEVDERAEVRRVADVRGEEAMERVRARGR